MHLYKWVNNITGWIVFVIAASLYLLTMEPTVSLWDCGEFITAAYKLEVGHPPGAPFYLMLGRLFSLFAIDKENVAVCINSLSAIASAFTILFLFWTITHLGCRILIKSEESFTKSNIIAIIGCGMVGALTFCFSDSFWFSATEAEVYGLSSLFTALVFWCILKWEEDPGIYANRWIVLIAFLMGISIGVHLLNLLAIPAIGMIYYFKKYSSGWKGTVLALMISFLILFAILYLIVPGTVKSAALLEMIFVNNMHLPVNSGLIAFVLTVVISLGWFLYYTFKKELVLLNTVFLCVAAIFIGYSSYAMIVIRAQASPPVNTGNPNNAFSLLAYLNRDQYGNRPLLYGQYYNAPVSVKSSEKLNYFVQNGKYLQVSGKKFYKYDERFMTVFPRMYSTNNNHIQVYKDWGTITGRPVKVQKEDGSSETIMKPTFGDNLEFFFKYQVGYMYLRYFMWNFAGKQNDMQGNGGIMRGNWISGFDSLDKLLIGSQRALPGYLKNNPGRNRYFLLPMLLGIAGMIFHFSRSRRYFWVNLLLFILTGLAIVIYTNQTPLQPRDRDYVYVGSFYAFSIWVGLGTLWVISLLKKTLNNFRASVSGVGLSMSIPVLMFSQNLDDHNRNGRYIARDIAYNYLNSCAPNSILFTVGDNDTYPLWYLQEVEGIRTDIRVVNLMLINADWYIDQLKLRSYHSAPLPISLKHDQYRSGMRNRIYIFENGKSAIPLKEAIQMITNDSLKYLTSSGAKVEFLPSQMMVLPVSKDAAVASGAVDSGNNHLAADSIFFRINSSTLGKNEMIVMDILAHHHWERPVYFVAPGYKGILGLEDFLRAEGFAYRLVPVKTERNENPWYGGMDTDLQYERLMETSVWHELKSKAVFMDDHARNMLAIMRVRQCYARLAMALTQEGNYTKATRVLDRVMEIMPPSRIPFDQYCIAIAEAYYKCGSAEKADIIVKAYSIQLNEELNFYESLYPWMKDWINTEKSQTLYYLEKLNAVKRQNGKR